MALEMMRSLLTTSALLGLPFLDGVDAFWRMNCAVIQTGRVDPLVDPGNVAAHAHTIVGASNIGVNSTYETLLNSECTSCEIEADKSAYWTPLLYYEYPNGSFIEVPHSGSVVYYLARGPNANSTISYPKGMMILTGDKGARSYDNVTMTYGTADYPGRPIADRISFVCLPDGPPLPEYPYMFNTTCANGMRAQIVFQSCWNGVDLYKSDNSHVAYLSGLDNGICPPDYTIQLPTLFIETDYAVADVPDQSDGGRFVFSQGDPTGYGFHADFMNGWETDVLQNAVDNCLVPDNFGQISYCPSLYASQSNGYPVNCPERAPQIGEPVHGLIDRLPGCITVTDGPEEAPAASMECPTNSPKPSITSTVNSTPRPTAEPDVGDYYGLPDQKYIGCYNDSALGIRTLNEIAVVNYTVMTVEWCQTYCLQQGYRLSGVEYAQECHCDNEINPTAVLSPHFCSWNCGGTMTAGHGIQEICGGLGYINVYNNTNPDFVAFGNMMNTAGNAQPYTPPAGFGPNYLGCYSDSSNTGRTLAGAFLGQNNMSLEICAEFCAEGGGYQYYGTEFTTQCYCGNFIQNGGTLLTPTSTPNNYSCDMRCAGNEPEICGGAGVISIYNNTGFTPPSIKPSIGKYHPAGCATDPNTHGRALQGASTTSPQMTEEMCVKFCLGHEFHYAGVEYGTQCFCDNQVLTSTGAVVGDCVLTDLMLCAGDIYEYCGGPSLMTLFYSATL